MPVIAHKVRHKQHNKLAQNKEAKYERVRQQPILWADHLNRQNCSNGENVRGESEQEARRRKHGFSRAQVHTQSHQKECERCEHHKQICGRLSAETIAQ